MAYGYNNYPPFGLGNGYQSAPVYGAQYTATPLQRLEYQPQFAQQSVVQQPGTLFARFVSGREEAVAAQVLPDGNTNVFIDSGHGRIYTKKLDSQTGIVDFREFVDVQPQPPTDASAQCVTMEMFAALQAEVEQLKQMSLSQTRRGSKEESTNAKSYAARANDAQ